MWVGVVLGAAVGWVLGQILFRVPSRGSFAETGTGLLSPVAALLAYGMVEIAEGNGFLAAGVAVQQVERQHPNHKCLHSYSEALETAVTGLLLVLLVAA
jgi:NhaP-type Na+/H+ or K+/H+ antiporter